MSAIPKSADLRGRAFPTPRTWDYAAKLVAFAKALDSSVEVRRLLVAGAIGEATAHEYLTWSLAQDLADPEDLLADVASARFDGMRPDRVYVILQSVLAVVSCDATAERWTSAVKLCARAAQQTNLDPAVPVVRALMREGLRPAGVAVPAEIRVFAGALALAGLLPKAR